MINTKFSPYNRFEGLCNIPEFGPIAKKQLQNAKTLIVGMGGLGNPCALYLAANGIGTLGISDDDVISNNNLSRQILFDPTMIGSSKLEQAIKKLSQINPTTIIKPFDKITPSNVLEIFDYFDFIIDATDNIASKLLINDACIKLNKPFCYAGVIQTKGVCMTILPQKSHCCRCVFPELSSAKNVGQCSQEGIFSPVAGLLGLIQATEAIKFYTKTGELLTNRLLSLEVLHWRVKIFDVSRQTLCSLCSTQTEPVF